MSSPKTVLVALCFMVGQDAIARTSKNMLYQSPDALRKGEAVTGVVELPESFLYNPATFRRVDSAYRLFPAMVQHKYNRVGHSLVKQYKKFNSEMSGDDIRKLSELVGEDLYAGLTWLSLLATDHFRFALIFDSVYHGTIHGRALPFLEMEFVNDLAFVANTGISFFKDQLRLAMNLKGIHRAEMIRHDDVSVIVGDRHYFKLARRAAEGNAFGIDLGLLLRRGFKGHFVYGGIALSDVGDTSFYKRGWINKSPAEAAEPIPQNLRVGSAVRLVYERRWLEAINLSYDYADILQSYPAKTKHRLGADIIFSRILLIGFGWFKGYPTYGFELNHWHTRLALSSYAEEVGVAGRYEPNRRYILRLGVEI